MAKPDERDDAFFREVDDEYRRSQLESWWSRYGRIAALGLVVLLIVLAGVLYWREDRARRAGETGEAFTQALAKLEAGNFTGAAPELVAIGRDGSPGYRALARLMQAATAVQAGDVPKGLAGYRAVAADASLPTPFRDLATIKATRLEFETLPPATVIAQLKPFAVPGNPWFAVAGEMTGIAYLREGKRDLAAPLFTAIVRDQAAPATIRQRAAQLAVSLGVDPAAFAPAKTLTGAAQ